MKKNIALLLALAVTTMLHAACNATPEKPFVIAKGDGELEKKLVATASPRLEPGAQTGEHTPAPTMIPEDGERIRRNITDKTGRVELTVDAKVIRYDNQTFSAAVVVPEKFSQEKAEKIIDAVVGDALFYEPDAYSREDIYESIVEVRQLMDSGRFPEKKEYYQRLISEHEAALENAVPDSELPPASRTFKKIKSALYTESISGRFKRNGKQYALDISNDDDGKMSSVFLSGKFSIVGRASADSPSPQVAIPYGQALEQAQKMVEDMQADLSLFESFVVVSESIEADPVYAYQFVFTREVNGFHVVFDDRQLYASEKESEKSASYEKPWPYEYLTITINGDGVQKLDWKGPSRVVEILNDNLTLLPFDEVMVQFEKMIFVKYAAQEHLEEAHGGEKAKVTVNRITLGLSRVQSGSKYYLIPVWDFYGTVETFTADGKSIYEIKGKIDDEQLERMQFRESLRSLLTINAVDGSVIDRSLGY